jgi:hypothetical protein
MAGVKWTEEENNQLMKEVMDGMDLDEVGKNIGEMCLHL